ncbi:MAG: ATP-binding protein [Kofleriaceae bacterium]|nr:ATP-binding protein [Kofleriaceae bacterium]
MLSEDIGSRRRIPGTGLALAVTAIAIVAGLALRPGIVAMPYVVPFIICALGVALATSWGGQRAGVISLVASAVVGALVFHDPPGPQGIHFRSLATTATFLVVGGLLVYLISSRSQTALRLHREHQRHQLSAEISTALDQSLDFEAKLRSLSQLFVPTLADWALIVLMENGVPRYVAVSHRDSSKIGLARQQAEMHPIDLEAPHGLGPVLRTGQSELIADVARKHVPGASPSEDAYRQKLRSFGVCSYMTVPIRRDANTVGAIALGMSDSGRHFDQDDLAMVQSLVGRISIAIENARLFHEAEAERGRAETASRAKDEFLAMLGHELRNPLAPIRTALDLMALRDPNALRSERTVIERQVRQLVTLVDDLLDVSRITRGMFELEREPVELLDVVTKGVETASPLVESRKHELFVDIEPGLVVMGDPARLAQVVANLLTNAAKYTEPGGRITVRGERVGDQAVLRVRDNGIGIPPEMLEHIFDIFVQAPQAIDRARGGLGLGLAIVKSIVARHGGTVTATSEGQGKGSELEVRLPALAQQRPHAPSPGLEPAKHARGRVLVVDDNPDALAMLSDALERRGFEISRAHDGPSALAIASRVHPEVALLDIGLPVMDGYELGRRLREEDHAVKLVAVTGYGRPGDFERSHEAGFAAHLVKPISLDRVQETIESLVVR